MCVDIYTDPYVYVPRDQYLYIDGEIYFAGHQPGTLTQFKKKKHKKFLKHKERLWTNLGSVGWISADRGTGPLSHLQYPVPKSESSTRDLSNLIFEFDSASPHTNFTPCESAVTMLWSWEPPRGFLWLLIVTPGKQNVSTLFSLDSGLEAFSHNPAHGSFSALTFQSTEFANYVNQRFLSY